MKKKTAPMPGKPDIDDLIFGQGGRVPSGR